LVLAAVLPLFFSIYQYKTEPHLKIKIQWSLKIDSMEYSMNKYYSYMIAVALWMSIIHMVWYFHNII
jgi:hypothetical protein